MDTITQRDRLLSIITPLDFDVLLIDSFVGSEGISRPFQFDVKLLADTLTSRDALVEPVKLIGNTATITIQLADRTSRFLHGIVRRFSTGSREERFVHYRAELVPWLSLMTLTSDCRLFQDKTVPEIVEAVFKEFQEAFPVVRFRFALGRTYTKWDYCVQYRESDFNFVSRLLEQEGIFYYFEHAIDAHTLVLSDTARYDECPNQASAQLGVQAGDAAGEDVITSWEVNQELLSGKWALRDYHFEMPGKTLLVEESCDRPAAAKNLEIYDYPGEYAQKFNEPGERLDAVKPEGDMIVRLRMEEEEVSDLVVSGTSKCRAFTSGYKYKVVSRGLQMGTGSYLLAAIRHSAIQTPEYISDHEHGAGFYDNSFTCIPANVPFRPARSTPKPAIQGPQTARVVDETKDPPHGKAAEEIFPDEFGRVRVRFPWDREGKYSCWVRVAQPWAGKGWGHQWIPRVGDEVIVDFLEGDPDCPIIVGSVYNGENAVPFKLPDNRTQSGIKTRSSPRGTTQHFNMIRLEDKKGQEHLAIHAQRNMMTSVENDHHLHVQGDHRDLTDGKSSHIVGGDRFDWHRRSHRTTTANEDFLEAPTVIVEAGQTLSLKGPGGFILIDPSGVTIVGTMVKINSGGAPATSSIGGGYIGDAADEPVDA